MHKVLLVDDESWVVESLKDLVDWEQYGFQIIGQAYNGTEALGAIERLKPDVVFTDIRMPEMNGLELLQRGRNFTFPIQFVVVSGYAEFAYAQKALTYGAAAYCLKPFDVMEITGVLLKISKSLADTKLPLESSLIHLLDDPSPENQFSLQEELKRHGILDWQKEGIVVVVAVGQDGLADMRDRVIKLKIGTSKMAYLLSVQQAETMMKRWSEHFPSGIMGIGIEKKFTDLSAIKQVISSADVLAHQFFIQANKGVFTPQFYSQNELNKLMVEMNDAILAKDQKAVGYIFDEIEGLFQTHALSIRHAFQVYNMTLSFLFGLVQTESLLYSYEQLVQSFPDVYSMLKELKVLASRYMKSSEPTTLETKNQTFNAILQFVTNHFHEEISLQNLSDQFFLNPSYISQLFKKEVGENLTAYIARLRIDCARELLESEEFSIHEIAEKIGYHDYFYFTRIFKKIVGKTPTQYRNEHI